MPGVKLIWIIPIRSLHKRRVFKTFNETINMKKIVFALVIAFNLLGCGRPPLDKPAINNLKSESLQVGQQDTIFKFTDRFPNNAQIAFALIKQPIME